MSAHLFAYLSACLLVCLSVCLLVCLSAYVFVCSSAWITVSLSNCLIAFLSTKLSIQKLDTAIMLHIFFPQTSLWYPELRQALGELGHGLLGESSRENPGEQTAGGQTICSIPETSDVLPSLGTGKAYIFKNGNGHLFQDGNRRKLSFSRRKRKTI